MRIACLALLMAPAALLAQDIARLRVDAFDAPRRLFHVSMHLPVKPGPLTLLYPQWIPGEHGPTGPVVNLVGLNISAANAAISWKRDSVNLYAFQIQVPAGVTAIDVNFDYIAPPEADGFTSGASTTSELAVLNWNQLLLYPKGADADSMQLQASLRVPTNWRYGTALPIQSESGSEIQFQPAPWT